MPYLSWVRVRYAETDQMGVAYHANYLVWMEVARVEFCRTAGFNYREMEETEGIVLAVIEATCRYIHPARFDDEVEIETTVASANTRMVHFSYEMRRLPDNTILARAESRHLFLNLATTTPARLPARYRPMFGLLP
jgi:acyl-CoA thioester hydrolase